MRKLGCLPALLLATGLLSGLALAVPELIILGLFALVIPGLILAFSPTAFGYLSLFSLGWFGAKRFGQTTGMVTGLVIAGMVGIVPAKIDNIQSAKGIDKVKESSVRPANPIAPPDHVTILQPSYSQRYHNINSNETNCDDLCLALLYGGTVKSVTMGTSQLTANHAKARGNVPAVTYTISREEGCQSERPIEVPHWTGWNDDERMPRLLFLVGLRTANGDCLTARPASAAANGLHLIFLESQMQGTGETTASKRSNPKVLKLEIRDKGTVVARSVDVEATEIVIPALFLPEEQGFKIHTWGLARRAYLNAEPITSVGRLRSLTGWPIKFPNSGIKGGS